MCLASFPGTDSGITADEAEMDEFTECSLMTLMIALDCLEYIFAGVDPTTSSSTHLSAVHSSNRFSPISVNFDSDSKVRLVREEQPLKHFLQIRSTELGMQIDLKDGQEPNTHSPIRFSLEPDSNESVESDVQ
jgi:hypothetical protein